MKNGIIIIFLSIFLPLSISGQLKNDLTRYVNPFIGTAEGKNGRATMDNAYTNPGAVLPWGLMSVSPFNIYDTTNVELKRPSPYIYGKEYISGFTHLNMSGTGCNEMGTFCLMPTTGLFRPGKFYVSPYSKETASPGYYSVFLDKYGVKVELTTTTRTAISRYTFPKGTSNVILNMGMGLSPQKGAMIKRISETEIEGYKMLGGICGMSSIHIVYFYAKLSKTPERCGIWLNGRFFENYQREVSGNDVGACFTYNTEKNETISIKVGVSFVSTKNARLNVEQESPGFDFDKVHNRAKEIWNKELSRIEVEGGTEDDKVKFYTALYHTLIHPNIFNDINGEYQMFESPLVGKIDTEERYTIFSLWDTYRNVHPFLALVYPKQQSAMIKSLLGIYKENGFLPRWDLAGLETTAMVGDPALPVIVDSWFRGIKDFDINIAYQAMLHNATTPEKDNYMRPGMEAWIKYGYIPKDVSKLGLRNVWGCVSTAMEYCIADWNLAQLAKSLGKKKDYDLLYKRAMSYKHNFDYSTGFMRPKMLNGKWVEPFDPYDKGHQEGFTEGNTWNYTYMVPHDIKGLIKLLGGSKKFISKLNECFMKGYFDITNEPDLAYPYLFNYVKGEEWRTQRQVRKIVNEDFLNSTDGLPGNDDCGTMSTWLMFSMMGFYPTCPGNMEYQLTSPVFDKIKIHLNPQYYQGKTFIIEVENNGRNNWEIQDIKLNGKSHKNYTISHQEIVNGGYLKYLLKKSNR